MATIILQTERLRLEVLGEEHFEDLRGLLANKNVHRHFPKVLNRTESREFLEAVQQRFDQSGLSFWAVLRKDDDRFLGICGLLEQQVDNHREIEVGYRILDIFWGEGYGTEAAKGCMEYARTHLGLKSIVSLILEQNTQSIRVAEKNGLQFEKVVKFHGLPHRLYRRRFSEETGP